MVVAVPAYYRVGVRKGVDYCEPPGREVVAGRQQLLACSLPVDAQFASAN